jgi:hypothetical protein
MEFLKDLYCRRIVYFQNIANLQAVIGMGDLTTYRLLKEMRTISTVVLRAIPKERVKHGDVESGKVLPILEAIEGRPKSLGKALVSWLTWPNEEYPSAVIISDGEVTEELFRNIAYTLAYSNISLTDLHMPSVREETDFKTKNAVLSKPVEV